MTTTKPNMLEFTKDISLAVANFYEYSMAQANLLEGIVGKETVFDVVVRNLPTNKIVGKFEFDGVKYEKLAKRNFLINCGIEQCLAYFLESKGNTQLRNYLENTQEIKDTKFLNWAENIRFQGDVCTTANDIAQVVGWEKIIIQETSDIGAKTAKILLEGGSQRSNSPQSSLFNSRA